MALIKVQSEGINLADNFTFTGTVAGAGGGKVLQVVQAENSSAFSSSSTSFVASGDIISITPSATSSKIFVMFNSNTVKYSTNNNTFGNIYRDINGGGYSALRGGRGYAQYNGYVSSTGVTQMSSMIVLDSPNTTSQCNYQSYWKNEIGGSFEIGEGGGAITSMIAWEIAG
jgi:hypothetical protein